MISRGALALAFVPAYSGSGGCILERLFCRDVCLVVWDKQKQKPEVKTRTGEKNGQVSRLYEATMSIVFYCCLREERVYFPKHHQMLSQNLPRAVVGTSAPSTSQIEHSASTSFLPDHTSASTGFTNDVLFNNFHNTKTNTAKAMPK